MCCGRHLPQERRSLSYSVLCRVPRVHTRPEHLAGTEAELEDRICIPVYFWVAVANRGLVHGSARDGLPRATPTFVSAELKPSWDISYWKALLVLDWVPVGTGR